jgi:hypothetical protein
MRLDRTILTLTLLGAVMAVPAIAQTQTVTLSVYPECKGKATREESEAAHAAFTFGKEKVEKGEYLTAVSYLKDAYRVDCTKHELLRMIARTYELAGNRAEAINALEVYLSRVPDAPDVETQRTRIANLRAQLPVPSVSVTILPSAPSVPPSVTTSPPPPPPPPPPPVVAPAQHTITPWILTGVGGAALITGGVLIIAGQSSISSANASFDAKGCDVSTNSCSSTSTVTELEWNSFNDKLDNGYRTRTAGLIVAGAGAAALVGGLVWHFSEKPRPRSRMESRIVPEVRSGYAGVGLSGRF